MQSKTVKVKSIDAPVYMTNREMVGCETDEYVINRAIEILSLRLREPGEPLNNPAAVRNYCILTAKHDHREHCRALYLDSQLRFIQEETVAVGTLTQASVYPREVVRRALEIGAAAIVLTHNHPSGMAEPSNADILLTTHLKKALNLIDVRLLDHIITAGSKAVSLAERGDIS